MDVNMIVFTHQRVQFAPVAVDIHFRLMESHAKVSHSINFGNTSDRVGVVLVFQVQAVAVHIKIIESTVSELNWNRNFLHAGFQTFPRY